MSNGQQLIPTLDPSSIRISAHALERYVERRGWGSVPDRYEAAEGRIRGLLECVQFQNPTIYIAKDRRPTVRYTQGDLAFIVSADRQTLITFYGRRGKAKGHKSQKAGWRRYGG